MTYLKKTKMYNIAKSVFDILDMPVLKDCEYRFYRGTEWLRFSSAEYDYEMCSMFAGKFLSVETYCYDDNTGNRVCVMRKVLNGCGKREVSIV